VDAVTAEVTQALGEAGVPSLLLKGPSIAEWLFEDGSRSYTDSDLLVDPARIDEARVVLERLGFTPAFGGLAHPGMNSPPSAPWVRGPFSVDLHETLPGARAARNRVWDLLSWESVELEVGGRPVRALSERARLVHIALHAAHHGPGVAQPLRDLEQALKRVGAVGWSRASELSHDMGAAEAFMNGLSLSEGGRRLADELDMELAPSTAWILHTAGGAPVAEGLERLRTAQGVKQRAQILAHELVPSPDFMRWWSPLARRSRRGLAAAYLWRIIYLASRAPGGVRVWRRARRQSTHFRRST
jgi:hypothetical protein